MSAVTAFVAEEVTDSPLAFPLGLSANAIFGLAPSEGVSKNLATTNSVPAAKNSPSIEQKAAAAVSGIIQVIHRRLGQQIDNIDLLIAEDARERLEEVRQTLRQEYAISRRKRRFQKTKKMEEVLSGVIYEVLKELIQELRLPSQKQKIHDLEAAKSQKDPHERYIQLLRLAIFLSQENQVIQAIRDSDG